MEVVTRTFQSRLLLTPKPLLNLIIIGALARASRRYGVQVVVMAFLSNHSTLCCGSKTPANWLAS